jgi:hypothetical protein
MPTKKTKKKAPAKVPIDAGTAVKLEKKLRDGLIGSPAHIIDGPPSPMKKKARTVDLDGATVARFANHLKAQLIGSSAHIFEPPKKKQKK